ncbi:MAG: hypothetical protein ACO2ZP_01360, partial [Bacteriovoracaceae bacterium]
MKKAYIFIFLLLLSCGGKKEKSTQTKFKFSAGAAISQGYLGGVVVMGKSATNSFQMVIPNAASDVEVNIPDGVWDFTIIGWDDFNLELGNTGPMTGSIKCDRSSLTINGEVESILNVNFSSTKCSEVDINQNNVFFSSQASLTLHPCFSVTSGETACSGDKLDYGVGLSYKIRLPSIDNTGVPNSLSTSLSSPCYSQTYDSTTPNLTNLYTKSSFPTDITMPAGGTMEMPFEILSYEGLNCSGDPIIYQLPKGLS